jgi:hypothetical protein
MGYLANVTYSVLSDYFYTKQHGLREHVQHAHEYYLPISGLLYNALKIFATFHS